jgi:NADH-quinone oxidoreductase subunit J
MLTTVLFALGAGAMLVSALAVILARSPLRAALYLICSLCSAALLYILLEASFVAAMQVLVYAGAIMVLFVFVIMLLNLTEGPKQPIRGPIAKIMGAAAVFYFAWQIGSAALMLSSGNGAPVDGTVKGVGTLLLTDYLFGLEAISILLLVAVVGSVVLGMKRLT